MADPVAEVIGQATIRDLYQAVGDVRTELGDKIDKLADTVNTVAVSHEHRLTIAEQIAAIHDGRIHDVEIEVKKHSDEISATNLELREAEAKAQALADDKSRRNTTKRWVIGTAIAVISVLITVGCLLLVH